MFYGWFFIKAWGKSDRWNSIEKCEKVKLLQRFPHPAFEFLRQFSTLRINLVVCFRIYFFYFFSFEYYIEYLFEIKIDLYNTSINSIAHIWLKHRVLIWSIFYERLVLNKQNETYECKKKKELIMLVFLHKLLISDNINQIKSSRPPQWKTKISNLSSFAARHQTKVLWIFNEYQSETSNHSDSRTDASSVSPTPTNPSYNRCLTRIYVYLLITNFPAKTNFQQSLEARHPRPALLPRTQPSPPLFEPPRWPALPPWL